MSTATRILHAHSGNLFGGIETVLVTLAHESPAHSFALCFPGELESELIGAAGADRVRNVGWVRLSRPLSLLGARRRFRVVLKELDPDVVMCHSAWSHSVFAPVARAGGRRVAHWMHAQPVGRSWLERLAQRTPPDVLLSNSRFTAEAAETLFPGLVPQVVYPPVPRIQPSAEARLVVRRELEVESDTLVVIMAGRLEEPKGHTILLRALGEMGDRPGWVLWLVGGAQNPAEETYLAELRHLANTLRLSDRVRFLGRRNDVPQLLAAADIFCHPNTRPEGFGVVFVEALYAGLPAIVSGVGGALEIVDRTCGILTHPGDVGGVRDALDRLMTDGDTRKQLGSAGPARAAELCDPRRQTEKVERAGE